MGCGGKGLRGSLVSIGIGRTSGVRTLVDIPMACAILSASFATALAPHVRSPEREPFHHTNNDEPNDELFMQSDAPCAVSGMAACASLKNCAASDGATSTFARREPLMYSAAPDRCTTMR